ncbi:subtilisin-like protein [Mycena albidolilacea]|uniref:Subtilisin-like protein n=1 Tax=Mycena albidolilacea TaxID=1033008 RepID=A0AAD6ZVJ5_9AGAR|nr:subtilisin-like protein [Mycena albidolilacea]
MPFRKLANLFTIISAVSASLVVHESHRAAPPGFFSKASNSFAAANGLKPTVVSLNGDWLSLVLMVSQANHLFGTQFEKFSHASLPEPITRTLKIPLPSELIGHINVVHPSTSFAGHGAGFAQLPFLAHSSEKRTEPVAACNSSRPDDTATPTCLQKIHGIPSTPATQKNNKILVTGYLGTSPNRMVLSVYFSGLMEIPAVLLEADLDIKYTVGTFSKSSAVSQQGCLLSSSLLSDSRILRQPFLDTNTFLDGIDNPPSVVTTSVRLMENQFESSVSKKICDSYMALGAWGISVLFGSGDGGVHGGHDNSSIPGFVRATFSSPSSLRPVPTLPLPEVAINLTGGGFSDLFPRPWYQTQAVDSFLKTITPDFAGTFNKSGCGYPDIAVQGWGLDLVFNGTTFTDGGTSFSSPIFASMIALVNDWLVAADNLFWASQSQSCDLQTRVSEGPTWETGREYFRARGRIKLTTTTRGWHFIYQGHNSGFECPTSSVAFDATKGWDALTGVGSPIFDKLLAAAFKY